MDVCILMMKFSYSYTTLCEQFSICVSTEKTVYFLSDTYSAYGIFIVNTLFIIILSHSLLQEFDLFPLSFQDFCPKMA